MQTSVEVPPLDATSIYQLDQWIYEEYDQCRSNRAIFRALDDISYLKFYVWRPSCSVTSEYICERCQKVLMRINASSTQKCQSMNSLGLRGFYVQLEQIFEFFFAISCHSFRILATILDCDVTIYIFWPATIIMYQWVSKTILHLPPIRRIRPIFGEFKQFR